MKNNYEITINHGNVKDTFVVSDYEKNKFIRQLNNNSGIFIGFLDIDNIQYNFMKREVYWTRVKEIRKEF